MRRAAAALVAAVLAVLGTAAPAAAHRRLLQEAGPGVIGVKDDRELKLYQAVAASLFQLGSDVELNITRPPQAVGIGKAAAAAPPVNASVSEVATAIAQVMAASAIVSEAQSTLGDPQVWP